MRRELSAQAPTSTFPVLSWDNILPDVAPEQCGGAGDVFKGRWRDRDTHVAIKFPRNEGSEESFLKAANALEHEISILRLMDNDPAAKFVVTFFGLVRGSPSSAWEARLGRKMGLYTGSNGDLVGLVMAWQDGGSLAERIHSDGSRAVYQSYGTSERIRIVEHVAEAVTLLHNRRQQHIVHGDIKSDNVLGHELRLADFNMSRARNAVATRMTSTMSTAWGSMAGGSWPYMAPEMYAEHRPGGAHRPAVAADRHTDVYALTTLIWEVLVGRRPWGAGELNGYDAVSRLNALRGGHNLPWEDLPSDVPLGLRQVLERGVHLDRDARPTAADLLAGLRSARASLSSGRFDIFLSHAWDGSEHAPPTGHVRSALLTASLSVWVDKSQMSHNVVASMRSGVSASTLVVALVSRWYASRPNCMLELRAAREFRKPIVAVIVDEDPRWWPSPAAGTTEEREMAGIINTPEFLAADLCEACAAGAWTIPLGRAQRARLDQPTALPRLLALVRDVLAAQARALGSGGVGKRGARVGGGGVPGPAGAVASIAPPPLPFSPPLPPVQSHRGGGSGGGGGAGGGGDGGRAGGAAVPREGEVWGR